MSDRLYPIAGNEALLAELRTMRRGSHLPHALLLQGMRGCGKKRIAVHFAMTVLCEQPEHAPCGICKSCRLIAEQAHPDVVTAEHSGKRMGFSVETVREIRREASVLPNNGDMRVFIFPDADGMSVQAQNALLKSVEEPPAHACFVFTCETAGSLLPTLLSRMTVKAVFPVTAAQCTQALTQRGYAAEEIARAVQHFPGNIGKSILYLDDEATRFAVDTVQSLTEMLAGRNEYELLRLLTAAASDRDAFRRILELLDLQIRDAAMLTAVQTEKPALLGCSYDSAVKLSQQMTPKRAGKLHGAITEALADLDGNVGAVLTATALCAALSET